MPVWSVKTFSTLSTWLWNDEVHYTKRHDKDLEFLKKHIDILLSRIDGDILEKEAEIMIAPSAKKEATVVENTTQEAQ